MKTIELQTIVTSTGFAPILKEPKSFVLLLHQEVKKRKKSSRLMGSKSIYNYSLFVGVVGFEPTQSKGSRFTVCPDSPTSAHSPASSLNLFFNRDLLQQEYRIENP